MRNRMTTGYVFRLASGFFGVISYYPQTTVRIYVAKGDNGSIDETCREMGDKFAGRFIAADRDTEAWGKAVFQAQGVAPVM